MSDSTLHNTDNNFIPLKNGRYFYMCNYNQIINSEIKDLFLDYGVNRKVTTYEVSISETILINRLKNLPMITFETSENCTLRCKYCIYGEHYKNWRNFSPKSMDFEIAKKGIDYIFSFIRNRERKEHFFCFYGGEPLLNVPLMEKVVEYSKNKLPGWKLHYAITTNLTILDDQILDFLVRNNFSLMVSLDGCQENHDEKRVFANGKGSFSTIYSNLEKIAQKHPEYFKKIRFSAVYSPDLSFKKMYDFFSGNPLVKNLKARFSFVSSCDTNYFKTYPIDIQKYRLEYNDALTKIQDKIKNGELLAKFEEYLFNSVKGVEQKLKKRRYSDLAGTCLFDSRLYVNAHGQFHTCERINQNFPIGDVEKGFDFQAMQAMVGDYTTFIKQHCTNCNIRFLCPVCYEQFAGNGKFEYDAEFCDSLRNSTVKRLEQYIQYKEEGIL